MVRQLLEVSRYATGTDANARDRFNESGHSDALRRPTEEGNLAYAASQNGHPRQNYPATVRHHDTNRKGNIGDSSVDLLPMALVVRRH